MRIYILICVVAIGVWVFKRQFQRVPHQQELPKGLAEKFYALSQNEQLRLIAAVFGKELLENKARFNRLLSDPCYTITPEDSNKSEEIINRATELILKAQESSPLTVFIQCIRSHNKVGQIHDYFENSIKYSAILEAEIGRYS